MKIKKEDRESIKTSLAAWAKKNKSKVREQGESIVIDKGAWSIEVIPEDGWAFLHGNGSLNGLSTNIESIDELDAGIKRLTGDK